MKALKSLSFRLALTYLGLFTASVLCLGALYAWIGIYQPMQNVRHRISQEYAELDRIGAAQGLDALARQLEIRAGEIGGRAAYHALIDRNGEVISANLPSWPSVSADGWQRIEADVAREGDEDEYEAIVLDRRRRGGIRLIVGRDIEDIDELEEGLKDTGSWLIPALVLLGMIGSLLMARSIGRRIEAIAESAATVIDGDLSARVPLTGAGDDFDQLSATLNRMLDRLQRSMEATRQFSDSVAHELRTPIARLRISLSEPSDGPEGLASARAETETLQKIVDAVLRISRIEAGSFDLAVTRSSLSTLLEDAIELYAPEAEQGGKTVRTEIQPGLETRLDRDLVFQAFANLIDNAIKFAPDHGSIEIVALREGDEIQVRIKNDSAAIDPDEMRRVGERLFRTSSAGDVPGLGLGLAFAKAVAEAHRSDLRFDAADRTFIAAWRFPA